MQRRAVGQSSSGRLVGCGGYYDAGCHGQAPLARALHYPGNLRLPMAPIHHQITLDDIVPSRPIIRGFTLIELVCVLAIMVILSTIAIPRFSNSIARHRAARTAHRIAADLALAQKHARSTSAAQAVTFDLAAHSYTLVGMRHLDHSSAEYAVNLAEEPYGATLVSVDFDGDAEVIFDGYGLPDNGGSLVVQVNTYQKTVTVDAETGEAGVP